MRIGLDYLPARTHAPGVGRYARELVRALAALPGAHRLALVELGLERATVTDLGLDAPACEVVRRRVPLPRRLLGWRGCPGLDRLAGGVDVFHHVLARPLPIARARRTVAVSELPAADGAAGAALARLLATMDGVLVFSRAAGEVVRERFLVDGARVHVVPVGCDHWRRARGPAELPDEPPVLLVLGAPRAVRRPAAIVAAHALLRRRGLDVRLRFVGGAAEPQLARVLAAAGGVSHDLPDEAALPEVVARAAALVHLNESEATPVTPLEAFSFGLPVVASDLPAFREALDGEAELLENGALDADPGGGLLADALARALATAADPAARARRRALAERFTWRRNAEATLAAWRAVLGR